MENNNFPEADLQKLELRYNKDTVDYWRHKRMHDALQPIIKNFPKSNWLTVGDGMGTESNYFIENGLYVHASDINDTFLKIASSNNRIVEYSKQNAESLTFKDNEFDFVYCKEAYHHFHRPAVAIYEMLRVAKIGIVLQEPKDELIFDNFIQSVFFYAKKTFRLLLGKKSIYHSFETVDNYIFTISPREIQKIAIGLRYNCIAYKVQQDFYQKGVELERADKESKVFKKVKKRIKLFEFYYKIGLVTNGLITGIILKEMPSEDFIKTLKQDGYKVEILPKNPYM